MAAGLDHDELAGVVVPEWDDETQRYFESRTRDGFVKVSRDGSVHGRGIVTTKDLDVDEDAAVDRPFAVIQSLSNSWTVEACAWCLRPIGSIRDQVQRVCSARAYQETWDRFDRGDNLEEEVEEDEEEEEEAEDEETVERCLLEERWLGMLDGEGASLSERFSWGKERVDASYEGWKFCCVDCVEEAEKAGCANLDPTVGGVAASVLQAIATEHNEAFFLVARAYARVLATWRSAKWSNLKQAMLPLLVLCHRPWPDTVLARWTKEDRPDSDETRSNLQQVLEEALMVIRSAVVDDEKDEDNLSKKDLRSWKQLWDIDFFSNIVGAMDLNSCSIRIASPAREYVSCLANESLTHAITIAAKNARLVRAAGGAEEDTGDAIGFQSDDPKEQELVELLPPSSGTGLFPLISATNHANDPNAVVLFPRGNANAIIKTTKPIKANQELTISYCTETLDDDIRSDALRHYGFN